MHSISVCRSVHVENMLYVPCWMTDKAERHGVVVGIFVLYFRHGGFNLHSVPAALTAVFLGLC